MNLLIKGMLFVMRKLLKIHNINTKNINVKSES